MGNMIIRNTEQWSDCFRFLQRVDIPKSGLEITWRTPRRSNQQNKYLWGVAYKTLAEGYSDYYKEHITSDHMHALCKKHFMPKIEVPGIKQTVTMSTTELCRSGNENAFQDYIIQIQSLAAHKGIYIPDPTEVIPNYKADETAN